MKTSLAGIRTRVSSLLKLRPSCSAVQIWNQPASHELPPHLSCETVLLVVIMYCLNTVITVSNCLRVCDSLGFHKPYGHWFFKLRSASCLILSPFLLLFLTKFLRLTLLRKTYSTNTFKLTFLLLKATEPLIEYKNPRTLYISHNTVFTVCLLWTS